MDDSDAGARAVPGGSGAIVIAVGRRRDSR